MFEISFCLLAFLIINTDLQTNTIVHVCVFQVPRMHLVISLAYIKKKGQCTQDCPE